MTFHLSTEQESHVPCTVRRGVQGAGPGELLQLRAEPGPLCNRRGARQYHPAKSWPAVGS